MDLFLAFPLATLGHNVSKEPRSRWIRACVYSVTLHFITPPSSKGTLLCFLLNAPLSGSLGPTAGAELPHWSASAGLRLGGGLSKAHPTLNVGRTSIAQHHQDMRRSLMMEKGTLVTYHGGFFSSVDDGYPASAWRDLRSGMTLRPSQPNGEHRTGRIHPSLTFPHCCPQLVR